METGFGGNGNPTARKPMKALPGSTNVLPTAPVRPATAAESSTPTAVFNLTEFRMSCACTLNQFKDRAFGVSTSPRRKL